MTERFLAGGGEMGERIRVFPCGATTLGEPAVWPQSLRVSVRLLLSAHHPMFIWWGEDLTQFYNDAYSETIGPERHPSALGATGRDCWAEIWHLIGPQIDFVMSGQGATYDDERLVPITRNGALEDVWWTYSYSPIDVDGAVGGVLVICNDVTEQHNFKEELAGKTRRLGALFEQAPSFMAVLKGPEHVFELTNTAYQELIGGRDVTGKSVREILPEVEGQGYLQLLNQVFTTGTAHVGSRSPYRVQGHAGGPLKDLFVDFVYQPIVESDGTITGVFVEGVDVTHHVMTETRLMLLNEELKHRVKNTLAMVSAIATQTLQGTGRDDRLKVFRGRLEAFGKAHDILTAEPVASALISDVVHAALAPHGTEAKRFSVSGENLMLGSKQVLSLALGLHELATNAAKYGALSNDDGRVEVTWNVSDGMLVFSWQEIDGPPVSQPTRVGFGSKLITRVLQADFNGKVDVSYDTAGFACVLRAKWPVR